MSYALIPCFDHESDWYCLADDGREVHESATVEGTIQEWVAIAEGIKRRESVCFRRCGAHLHHSQGVQHGFTFRSPRNSQCDEAWMGNSEADAFADSVSSMFGSGMGI